MRIGLIGAGALGAAHAMNLAAIPDCRLAAVVSEQISDGAQKVIDAAGAAVVNARDLFAGRLVDALLVATPTDSHQNHVLRAIDAGLPVMCEKPLARTLDEALQIRDLAAERKVKVAVGHVVRYFPEYAAARDLVHSGWIGTPTVARLARVNAAPAGAASWYADTHRSGGVLLDMAIHDIDWCLWTFGPAARVYAVSSGDATGHVVAVTIRHTQGTISYLDASWRDESFGTRLEVAGTNGLYRNAGSSSAGFAHTRTSAAPSYLPPATDRPLEDDPYLLELRAALDWFRGGPAPRATSTEACQAIEVVEAAQRSVDTGRPVDIEGTST